MGVRYERGKTVNHRTDTIPIDLTKITHVAINLLKFYTQNSLLVVLICSIN